MTLDRFNQYCHTILAAVFCFHLVLCQGTIWHLMGREDLIEHPLPIALPVALCAALYGWWLVYSDTPPAMVDQ
jgi:hypothetical protein